MTDKTDSRIREIRRRTRQKRKKMEQCVLSGLTLFSIFLAVGLQVVFSRLGVSGISTVSNSYSTVLLRDGTSAYVVTAVAAFSLGVILTVFCIRYKKRSLLKDRALQLQKRSSNGKERKGQE